PVARGSGQSATAVARTASSRSPCPCLPSRASGEDTKERRRPARGPTLDRDAGRASTPRSGLDCLDGHVDVVDLDGGDPTDRVLRPDGVGPRREHVARALHRVSLPGGLVFLALVGAVEREVVAEARAELTDPVDDDPRAAPGGVAGAGDAAVAGRLGG